MPQSPPNIVNDLKKALQTGNAIIVCGAGVSMASVNPALSGSLSWRGVLIAALRYYSSRITETYPGQFESIKKLIEAPDVHSMILAAEWITEKLDAPNGEFQSWLRGHFEGLKVERPQLIEAILDLNTPIITTNYDYLIEKVRSGYKSITQKDTSEVTRVIRGEEKKAIIHLHGIWNRPDSIILGIKDYEAILNEEIIQSLEKSFLLSKSFVFIGCGDTLSDPNIGKLLDWGRKNLKKAEHRHYRLENQSKYDELIDKYPLSGRIALIGYGQEHDDLAGFLTLLKDPKHEFIDRPENQNPQQDNIQIESGGDLIEVRTLSQTGGKKRPTGKKINEPPKIVNFKVSKRGIVLGESVKVEWQIKDAESVEIIPGYTDLKTSYVEISPKKTTSFTLRAKNKFGEQKEIFSIEVVRKRHHYDLKGTNYVIYAIGVLLLVFALYFVTQRTKKDLTDIKNSLKDERMLNIVELYENGKIEEALNQYSKMSGIKLNEKSSLTYQSSGIVRLIYENSFARQKSSCIYHIGITAPVLFDEKGINNGQAGESIVQGAVLAIHKVNESGVNIGSETCRFVAEVRNDGSSYYLAKRVANYFVEKQDILGVVGPYSSTSLIGKKGVYEQDTAKYSYNHGKLPLVAPKTTVPNIAGDFIFRTAPSCEYEGRELVKILQKTKKNILLLVQSEDAYSEALGESIERGLNKQKLTKKYINEFLDSKDQDDVDIVVAGLAGELSKVIAKVKVNKQNADVDIYSGNAGYRQQVFAEKINDLTNGVTVVSFFHPEMEELSVKEFTRSFSAYFGGTPNANSAQSYDAARALIEAIKASAKETNGKITRENVRAALSQVRFLGVTGKDVAFDTNGDIKERPLITLISKNGRYEVKK
jgi:ABC-type branched-subunit amino acid transport system substrate-binding protein